MDFISLQLVQWSCEDVCGWLVEQGLAEYSHNFRSHAIDGRELLTVTDEILEHKLGVGKFTYDMYQLYIAYWLLEGISNQ